MGGVWWTALACARPHLLAALAASVTHRTGPAFPWAVGDSKRALASLLCPAGSPAPRGSTVPHRTSREPLPPAGGCLDRNREAQHTHVPCRSRPHGTRSTVLAQRSRPQRPAPPDVTTTPVIPALTLWDPHCAAHGGAELTLGPRI